MELEVPPDIEAKIRSLLATGRFANEGDVLRQAMAALKRRHEDEAATNADSAKTDDGSQYPSAG